VFVILYCHGRELTGLYTEETLQKQLTILTEFECESMNIDYKLTHESKCIQVDAQHRKKEKKKEVDL